MTLKSSAKKIIIITGEESEKKQWTSMLDLSGGGGLNEVKDGSLQWFQPEEVNDETDEEGKRRLSFLQRYRFSGAPRRFRLYVYSRMWFAA